MSSRCRTSRNYTEALTRYWPQFSRSLLYGAAATLLTFAISYPLAYTIAFRGGRYKNLLLFLVVAPFFTSFLLRTISWKIILGDTGILLGPLKEAGILPDEFRLLATPIAVVAGITYNFLPFMTLADLRLAREGRQAPGRGRRGPVRHALRRVPPDHLPAVAAGRLRRLAADVHPGDGRLRQRGAARQPADDDDRERDPATSS